jgi:hypothetical protein
MSARILTQREIEIVANDTRVFYRDHNRVEQTASFARQITALANARRVTPLVPAATIEALLRVLQRHDRAPTAATLARCFEILRQTVLEPRELTLPTDRRPQQFEVRVCPVSRDALRLDRRSIIGSAGDPSTKPGCDRGAGVDYYAKTDTHTVYMASTLLSNSSLFDLVHVRDGLVPIVSLTLMAILHEFGHAYSTFFPYDFAKLRDVYYAAVAVARPFAQRAETNHNAARLLMGEDDCMEFLAQAFAYENTRADYEIRRADDHQQQRRALMVGDVFLAAMASSLPLLSNESTLQSVGSDSSMRSASTGTDSTSGSLRNSDERRDSGSGYETAVQ